MTLAVLLLLLNLLILLMFGILCENRFVTKSIHSLRQIQFINLMTMNMNSYNNLEKVGPMFGCVRKHRIPYYFNENQNFFVRRLRRGEGQSSISFDESFRACHIPSIHRKIFYSMIALPL